jgi:hypothetical protein
VSATAAPRRSAAEEVLSEVSRGKVATSTKQQTQAKASIETNPFYSEIFSESLSPEQKTEQVSSLLTVAGAKEEVRNRAKEHNEFKEWLQQQRKLMAQEVIKLVNTETFSQLQEIYDELGNGINNFEDKMTPLTEIVEALFKLRTKGQTLNAIKEITEQKKLRAEITATLSKQEGDLTDFQNQITDYENDNIRQAENKSWGGFGGIKEASRVKIAQNNKQIETLRGQVTALEGEIADTKKKLEGIAFTGELAEEKMKLKELLDLSNDTHKKRVEDLVSAANGFVEKADTNIAVVRGQLGNMTTQVENLFDANNDMSRVYAILDEGEKRAEIKNAQIRDALQPKEGESAIDRLSREEKKMLVEEFIGSLQQSSVDTVATFADLQRQAGSVKGMRDSLNMQIVKARSMATRGVAGVADRLATVVNAVAQAAVNESQAFAGDALTAMRDSTNRITMQDTIKNAMGLSDVNVELEKALTDLGEFTSVQRKATDIARENLTDMRSLANRMMDAARDTASAVQDSLGVAADTFRTNTNLGSRTEDAAAPTNISSPFKLGKV